MTVTALISESLIFLVAFFDLHFTRQLLEIFSGFTYHDVVLTIVLINEVVIIYHHFGAINNFNEQFWAILRYEIFHGDQHHSYEICSMHRS